MVRSSLLPAGLLLVYAVAFGIAAFGVTPPGFDDHPGQIYRLQHAVAHGPAPWAWNPGWWTGYPELQFYPPGFFYAGLMLRWLSIGSLSATAIYQVLLWLTWIAPGATAYALLVRACGSGWAALPGAFVVLTLSAGTASGVEGAVHVGMLPARLALALLPVLALVLLSWLERPRRAPWAAIPLLAAVALVHPTHVPGAVALLVLAALLQRDPARSIAWAVGAIALAAGLTAFWSVPLLGRLEHTRALAWGSLDLGQALRPAGLTLLALAILAWQLARSRGQRLVAIWPLALAAALAVDAVAAERLGVRWLPSDRVADAGWLAVVLAAALSTSWLAGGLARRLRLAPAWVALGVAVVAATAALDGRTLTVWPGRLAYPGLGDIERGLRLDALWSALRRDPGTRVLFTRSGVPLVYGTEWWRPHTHATALTPIRAGRPIVHGTFTHPSPVAAFMYRGHAGPGAIDALAERLDGRTLLGQPLEALDAAALTEVTDRLAVGAVVVLDEDLPRLAAVTDNAAFERQIAIGPFTVYRRLSPRRLPVRETATRWRLDASGQAGDWIPAGLAYYPLWSAERDGHALATRRGEIWGLEVRLDGGAGPVTLLYRPGAWEKAGLAVTVVALVSWSIAAVRPGRRR